MKPSEVLEKFRVDLETESRIIPFGLPYLDYLVDGVRCGAITLISGAAYSGKSTLALLCCSNSENPCYIDSEGAITKGLLELRGASHADVFSPGDLQSMLSIAESAISSDDYDLVVLDSPSICYPKPVDSDGKAADSALDEPPVGLGARYFSSWIRRTNSLLRVHKDTAIIVIQHERQQFSIGSYMPARKTVALGSEQVYAADLHVKCSGERITVDVRQPKGDPFEGSDTTIQHCTVGLRVHWKIEKARCSLPDAPVGSFLIGMANYGEWETGKIYLLEEKLRYLTSIGALERKGAWFETPIGRLHGRQSLIDAVDSRWDEIIAKLQEVDNGQQEGKNKSTEVVEESEGEADS